VINATSCDCFLLFRQSSTRALSSKHEVDVFGISYTKGFAGRRPATLSSHTAAAIAPGSSLHPCNLTPGSLLGGIAYFSMAINAFLIYGLNIQDKLVLCLCYTDTALASLLLREQQCLTAAGAGSAFSTLS